SGSGSRLQRAIALAQGDTSRFTNTNANQPKGYFAQLFEGIILGILNSLNQNLGRGLYGGSLGTSPFTYNSLGTMGTTPTPTTPAGMIPTTTGPGQTLTGS